MTNCSGRAGLWQCWCRSVTNAPFLTSGKCERVPYLSIYLSICLSIHQSICDLLIGRGAEKVEEAEQATSRAQRSIRVTMPGQNLPGDSFWAAINFETAPLSTAIQ